MPIGAPQNEDYFKRLGEQLVSGISADKAKSFADVKIVDQAVESRGLTAGQLVEMGREYANRVPSAPVLGLEQHGGGVITAGQALVMPDFSAITSEFLKNQGTINVPSTPTPTTPDIAGGQASIDSLNKLALGAGDSTSLFQQFLKSAEPPPSLADEFTKSQQSAGIPGLEQNVLGTQGTLKAAQSKLLSINAELEAIKAEEQSIPIRAQEEAKGRGITAAGLEPVTSAKLRDLALRAIPIQVRAAATQAEVFSAQGDVQLAEGALKIASDRMNQLFDIRTQDATNLYNYWRDIRGKVFDFLSTSEKRKLDQQQIADDRNFTLLRDKIKNQQDLANTFLQNGQADLATKIGQLDPNLSSFDQDLAGLQAQFRPAAPKLDTQILDVGGRKLLVDSQTGNVIRDLGISGVGGGDGDVIPKLSPARQEDIATGDTLTQLAQEALSLGERIGFKGVGGLYQGSIRQFLAKNFGFGSSEEQDLRNLIGNITGTLAKLRGGTSFTKNEQKLLETYSPTINDSALVLQSKLNSLLSFIQQKRGAIIKAAGGQESGDSLGIR